MNFLGRKCVAIARLLLVCMLGLSARSSAPDAPGLEVFPQHFLRFNTRAKKMQDKCRSARYPADSCASWSKAPVGQRRRA
jgi:hypothetical protein